MKCCKCPLFEYYPSEDGSWVNCSLFGDSWEEPLQYEDKEGTTIGCYVERCYIEKFAKQRDEEFARMAESMARDIKERDEEPLFTMLED
jgi:hypothetical protein